MVTIEAGALTMLFLEALKWIVGKIKQDPTFNFPPIFFKVAIPVLNAVMPFVLVYGLGQASTDPILTMDVASVVRYLVSIALASLVTLVGYDAGLKPLKEYARRSS